MERPSNLNYYLGTSALLTGAITLGTYLRQKTLLNPETNLKGVFLTTATNTFALSLSYFFIKERIQRTTEEVVNDDLVNSQKNREDASNTYKKFLDNYGRKITEMEDEIKKQERKVKKREDKVQDLERKKTDLEKNIPEVRTYVEIIVGGEKRKKELSAKVNELNKRNDSIRSQITDLEEARDGEMAKEKKTSERLEKLNLKQGKSLVELEGPAGRLSVAENQLKDYSEEKIKNSEKLITLDKKRNKLLGEKNQAVEGEKQSTEALEKHDDKIKTLTREIEISLESAKKKRDAIQSLTEANKGLQKELEDLIEGVSFLKTNHIDTKERILIEANQAILLLTNKIDDLKRDNVDAWKSLPDQEKKILDLESALPQDVKEAKLSIEKIQDSRARMDSLENSKTQLPSDSNPKKSKQDPIKLAGDLAIMKTTPMDAPKLKLGKGKLDREERYEKLGPEDRQACRDEVDRLLGTAEEIAQLRSLKEQIQVNSNEVTVLERESKHKELLRERTVVTLQDDKGILKQEEEKKDSAEKRKHTNSELVKSFGKEANELEAGIEVMRSKIKSIEFLKNIESLEMDDFKLKIEKLSKVFQEVEDEIEKVRTAHDLFPENKSRLENKIQEIKREKKPIDDKIQRRASKIEELKQKQGGEENSLQEMQKQITELYDKLELEEEQELWKDFHSQTKGLDEGINRARRSLRDKVGAFDDPQKTLADKEEEIRKTKESRETAESRLKHHTGVLTNLNSRFEEQVGVQNMGKEAARRAWLEKFNVYTEKSYKLEEKTFKKRAKNLFCKKYKLDRTLIRIYESEASSTNEDWRLQARRKQWLEDMIDLKGKELQLNEKKLASANAHQIQSRADEGEKIKNLEDEVSKLCLEIKIFEEKLLRHDLIIEWSEGNMDAIYGQNIVKSLVRERNFQVDIYKLENSIDKNVKIAYTLLEYSVKAHRYKPSYNFRDELIKLSNEFNPNRQIPAQQLDPQEDLPPQQNETLYKIASLANDDFLSDNHYSILIDNLDSLFDTEYRVFRGNYGTSPVKKGLDPLIEQLKLFRLYEYPESSRDNEVGLRRKFFEGKIKPVKDHCEVLEREDSKIRKYNNRGSRGASRIDTFLPYLPAILLLAYNIFHLNNKFAKCFGGKISWSFGRTIFLMTTPVHYVLANFIESNSSRR